MQECEVCLLLAAPAHAVLRIASMKPLNAGSCNPILRVILAGPITANGLTRLTGPLNAFSVAG